MIKLLAIILSLSFSVSAQKFRTSAYYAETQGPFYSNRLVFIPLQDGRYLLEYYFYGGNEFKGEPRRDTFVQKGSILRSQNLTASFQKGKLLFTSKEEGKKQFSYRELQPCDSLINITRNWTYRETLKRKLDNEKDRKSFDVSTDYILSNFCYEDFILRAGELKNELEEHAGKE